MQDSERDRLTVEVCEAVSAISPAGSHLATTAARLREMVGQEVPMPDDDIMCDALEHLAGLDTHDVNLRDNPKAYEVLERLVRTYGVACRAAGEAAGYARGLADERERICAAIKAEDDYCVTEGDYMLDSDDCIRVARGTWERPDYALRGEVK